jgi:hypothetical protein
VAEGVSSFDGIVNQLRLGQFAKEGLRLVNLGDGSGTAREFTPAMDTLFFSLWTLEAGKPGLKKEFLSKLSAAYAPQHPVFIIDHPASVKTEMARLPASLKKAALTTTLFVPAARPRFSAVKRGRNAGRKV